MERRTRSWGTAPWYGYKRSPASNPMRWLPAAIIDFSLLFITSTTMAAESSSGLPSGLIRAVAESQGLIELVVDKSRILGLKTAASRVSIVNPDIADIQVISPSEIVLTGQAAGETTMVVWDENNDHAVVDVRVTWNLGALQSQLDRLFPDDIITCRSIEGGIALEGMVSSLDKLERVVALAERYSPDILNMLNVPGVHQVLLEVRIAELARDARREIGSNLLSNSSSFQGMNRIGGLITPGEGLGELSVADAVTLFFGFPNSDLEVFIQALQDRGVLRILAEPNLVAASGESASFLVGGEFPVPVAQGSGGGSVAITVEWREFGVRLSFLPTVYGDGRIRLHLRPEVSDLDFTAGVQLQGFLIPAIVSRNAETTVDLVDSQTFAIAGLISSKSDGVVRKVPALGNVPILGGLFRSAEFQQEETELVMIVTPHLIAPLQKNQVASIELPGQNFEPPTDKEFYKDGTIEKQVYNDGADTPSFVDRYDY